MKSLKSLYALLPLLILSACAPMQNAVNPYEEDFKCHAKDDTGKCIDTPSAYQEARFPEAGDPSDCPNCPDKSEAINPTASTAQNASRIDAQSSRYRVLTELLEEPDKPMLEPPKIMRVLMLPYKGEQDELFMPRYVYLKLRDSQWILTDINEKIRQ